MPDEQKTVEAAAPDFPIPSLAELQHWTGVIGRAQQMMLEHGLKAGAAPPPMPNMGALFAQWPASASFDIGKLAAVQSDFWRDSVAMWQRFLVPAAEPAPETDKRFKDAAWASHPAFALIRQAYAIAADTLIAQVDAVDGISDRQREQLRFATRSFVEAASPANFLLTNPQALTRAIETRGESLLKGLENLLRDLGRGQLSHTAANAFEIGRDIAATPGKVIHETPLYQLIQYAPSTGRVDATPVVIFPPWINRFYILDLGPKKSFVRWAVAQGLTVFMVSWKSADAETADTHLDDYVAAQIEAVDIAREVLGVESAHVIGYCVAGTVLAATLALLAARGEADKVASATFFTAQVDFERAGDLSLLIADPTLGLIGTLAEETGVTDGRYLAAAFNLLRSRDLVWNYVSANYLLGEEYQAFDLLHWNGDVTNLPGRWHHDYLRDFYRDNRLVVPGGITIMGTPINLTTVATPAYVQAGREDHIAPAESVWKLTEHFAGPMRFVLAGSGHIAGVVNPPAAGKYQFWTAEEPAASLAEFVSRATETKGSWWPHWRTWIDERSGGDVAADGARVPGQGSRTPIEDAPGRYVRAR
ncbi:PHA/PHB synthase family protein [Sphingomonas sp.]|uniref:PHA/PHB synthase family protein n=1 Tax=Sphingomonas sp. TaxID=28214 RepID=UPI003B007AA1